MELKCNCKDPSCKTMINTTDQGIFLTDKEGKESLLYLDSNQLVGLINDLRSKLIDRTKG